MAYTEVKHQGRKKQYYRVVSIRYGQKVGKRRIYLGSDLADDVLTVRERQADRELGVLSALLDKNEVKALARLKRDYKKLPKATRENRYEAFVSQFTHDSTAIEGNTLTLQETASLLFEGLGPNRKTLREINEVVNHRKAFDHILAYEGDITKKFICKLHELVVKETLDEILQEQVGKYRTLPVYIRGVDWTPANPEQVPTDMKTLLAWYTRNKDALHPLVTASYFHVGFETVHPFVDGNGRVGRLLFNFILHRKEYPMVNFPCKDKNRYYEVLHTAQVEGRLKPFVTYCLELMDKTKLMF